MLAIFSQTTKIVKLFVQAAVEASVVEGGSGADKGNLNLGLVLQEVRRRADSDTLARHTQDIFKAVHNVQKRLLEEHVSSRLYKKKFHFKDGTREMENISRGPTVGDFVCEL
jgi:hypothetical protein